jgi:hypothetical protein
LIRTKQIICPKGYYCQFGRLYEIPPGRYGDKLGVTHPNVTGTGMCQAGYYCPPASTSSTQLRCGNGGTDGDNSSILAATFYCPIGSGDPTPTDVGYYTSIGTLQGSELNLIEKRQWWNLPGLSKDPRRPWKCKPPHRKSIGHVSEDGSNQDECAGTTPPNEFSNPPSGRNYDEGIKFEQTLCEEGYFCVDGRRNACPRGRYGDKKGITTNLCSGNCAPGYICPAGSFSDKQVPCGSGRDDPSAYYCPGYGTTGSWLPLKVDTGYYTVGGDEIYNHTRYAQKICPLGHFCKNGKRYRCPGGTYGNTTGLSTSLCSGKCPSGYFCRPATVEALESGPNGIDVLIRDQHLINLNNLGVLETKFLLISNYTHLRPFECGSIFGVRGPCYPTTTGKTALELRTGDRRCELEVTFGNKWTIGDWEMLYHFGNGWDTIVHNEVQDLTPRQPLHYHYHTQYHTDSRTRISAEASAVYCPEGSDVPTTVGPGYYTVGGNEFTNRTRTNQKLVEFGYFAEAGRKLRCPPGTYGGRQGLSTDRCSGFCPAAHYCPWATATPIPCADGHYSAGGTFYCMKCQRPAHTQTKDTCKTGRNCCFL